MFERLLKLIRDSQIKKCKCNNIVITNEVKYFCYQCGKLIKK